MFNEFEDTKLDQEAPLKLESLPMCTSGNDTPVSQCLSVFNHVLKASRSFAH